MVKTSKKDLLKSDISIPSWLSPKLTSDDVKQIESSIAKAEATTSGEIVPVIVRRSAPLKAHGMLASLICALVFFGFFVIEVGDWLHFEEILFMILGLAVSAALGQFLVRFKPIYRLLQHPKDAEYLAIQRAELEFHRAGISATRDKTGIILYLAIEDRQAIVLADQNISAKLPPETWGEVMSLMLTGIKQGQLAYGLQQAITKCGEILTAHFPIKDDDTNELVNRLIIRD